MTTDSIKLKGHVIIRDAETGEILREEDNLVLMNTRVWLFQQLFKVDAPGDLSGYKADNSRQICLFSIGMGGADINANAFTPFVPKFNDKALGQMIPFVTIDPDKPNNSEAQANPSVLTQLTAAQQKTYYMSDNKADGTRPYYAKRFTDATDARPLGKSRGWVISQQDGSVAFSLSLSIDKTEARGATFNELGLWMGTFDAASNSYSNLMLATRLTLASEPLTSLTKSIDIEYILYI